ncbi:MAG: AbrB/MazE/SpoVT family DNA-binding domain-containing protein [Flavisolibacter sp.]|nr:AbrB/MazE/SpoVT family DNA-binding domain-containing protein [Flavisolibacter sp.]MBD0351166.1 AbrB/MazE/SpoVT family DNA-binding domain-containing protein [Flavisolibacter sp.]
MKEKVHFKKIGNSKGVILSKKILEAAGISDTEAELIIEAGREGITIKPSSGEIREGWSEAFREIRKNEDNKLIIPDVFEDESF